jgi:hypothetical protein
MSGQYPRFEGQNNNFNNHAQSQPQTTFAQGDSRFSKNGFERPVYQENSLNFSNIETQIPDIGLYPDSSISRNFNRCETFPEQNFDTPINYQGKLNTPDMPYSEPHSNINGPLQKVQHASFPEPSPRFTPLQNQYTTNQAIPINQQNTFTSQSIINSITKSKEANTAFSKNQSYLDQDRTRGSDVFVQDGFTHLSQEKTFPVCQTVKTKIEICSQSKYGPVNVNSVIESDVVSRKTQVSQPQQSLNFRDALND